MGIKVLIGRRGYPVYFDTLEEYKDDKGQTRYIGNGKEFDINLQCVSHRDFHIISVYNFTEEDVEAIKTVTSIYAKIKLLHKHLYRLKYMRLSIESLRVIDRSLAVLLSSINDQ